MTIRVLCNELDKDIHIRTMENYTWAKKEKEGITTFMKQQSKSIGHFDLCIVPFYCKLGGSAQC